MNEWMKKIHLLIDQNWNQWIAINFWENSRWQRTIYEEKDSCSVGH